ncbi:MAG: T9SS type A sorting domain-containing protein [Bacteroidales bacterium]
MTVSKNYHTLKFHWLAFCLLIFFPLILTAQVPAFPGAEGFGAVATGGRGGSVIEVTNLNNHGPGSLRAAIQASGARTVVFRVSGTIELTSELRIDNDNITIAGQTAPGEGICLKNFPLIISANNVIIRFIRSRHGDLSGSQDDAMGGRNQENIIIDHCSMSWSVDECASFYDNKNFTLQYCILSESLWRSIHDKGDHGYGGIWGGQGATFHHNLLAHHTSRTPRFNGSRYSGQPELELVDHRNNVIYNWGFNSCYGGEAGNHNMVANYYKYGPATSISKRDRIVDPDANENGYGTYYIAGNVTHGYPATTEDNWRGVDGVSSTAKEEIRLDAPLEAPALTPHTAHEAFEHVVARAGAVLPKRDPIDTRIVHETVTGTPQYGGAFGDELGIIDSQETVGGWPALEGSDPPADTDHDGMPDDWEDTMGLNKDDPADRNGDLDGDGYTNLEEYLNELVEAYEYILRPIHLAVDTVIEYAVSLTWEDISDNETGFVLERKSGDTWTELTTTAANATSYTDNSLSTNGVYFYRLKAVNESLQSFYTDSVAVNLNVGMEEPGNGNLRLEVYPNPFAGTARLEYTLRERSRVSITLHDAAGKQVMQLEDGLMSAGSHQCTVNRDQLPGGIYFIRLRTDQRITFKKVLVTD